MLAAVAGIGIVAGVGTTMSAWTDTATVTGDLTSGQFELSLDGAQSVPLGTPDQVLNPGDEVADTYTRPNGSTTSPTVDFDVTGFTTATAGAWDLTVQVGDTVVYSGDPTTATATIPLGEDSTALVLDEDGTVDVQVSLTLVDTTTAPESEVVSPALTFTAVQV